MLAVKNSHFVHVSDTAKVIVSFVDEEKYFLHIRRRVRDVQHELDRLQDVIGALDREAAGIDTQHLPQVLEVYEASIGASGAPGGVSLQVLASAAVDLDIAPDGRPVTGEFHTVLGVKLSPEAFDVAVQVRPDLEKQAWYSAFHYPPFFAILYALEPPRWVAVDVVVPPEVAQGDADWAWKYEEKAREIVRALFPDAEIGLSNVRIRQAAVYRFLRNVIPGLLQQAGDKARLVKVGCTTFRAVRLDEVPEDVQAQFRPHGRYQDIEYVLVYREDQAYYLARRGDRWYAAVKVEGQADAPGPDEVEVEFDE